MPHFTIVGAGPVGTLMALMLARRGAQVDLLERRPDPRLATPERGRSINLALAARGILALEHAELMGRLRSQLIAMPGRMLHDEQQRLQFMPYGQFDNEVNYAVGREQLNRILIDAAAGYPGIRLRFELRCLDLNPEDASLTLRDERDGSVRQERFETLLAADGAGSAVRGALVQRGLSHCTEAPLAHDYKELSIPPLGAGTGTATQYAFAPHALHIWPRGGFMLIALPNPDRSFTATLFLAREGDPGFSSLLDTAAAVEFCRREFADAAAAVPDLGQQFEQHPQSRLGTVYCSGWQAAGRVLLLGDAAHAIVPFHGQGLNAGFEDCRLLDSMLAGGRNRSDVLRVFESQRRPDTDAIAAMALENYQEMRDTVRSPLFGQRRALAAALERALPGRFIPRYSMVMFHPEIPYAQARARGARQEAILDALLARGPRPAPDAEDLQLARSMLDGGAEH
jgi:kynurenine 3-monooxygenase